MPAAFLRTARSLALVAVFFIAGGQWITLQSIAWGRMLADFSSQTSVAQAIVRTFDGQHPCAMCREVEKGSGEQKRPEIQLSIGKLVMIPPLTVPLLFPPLSRDHLPLADLSASSRTEAPPIPPPRARLS